MCFGAAPCHVFTLRPPRRVSSRCRVELRARGPSTRPTSPSPSRRLALGGSVASSRRRSAADETRARVHSWVRGRFPSPRASISRARAAARRATRGRAEEEVRALDARESSRGVGLSRLLLCAVRFLSGRSAGGGVARSRRRGRRAAGLAYDGVDRRRDAWSRRSLTNRWRPLGRRRGAGRTADSFEPRDVRAQGSLRA